MPEVLKSATRIALLMFTLTLCVGVLTGKITEDTFKVAALLVLAFFFTVKAGPPGQDQLAGK